MAQRGRKHEFDKAVLVRLKKEDLDEIREQAKMHRIGTSTFMRLLVLEGTGLLKR